MGDRLSLILTKLIFYGTVLTWFLPPPLSGFAPGLTSHSYQLGDPIEIKVNGLTSIKSQLPYSFYHLPYCRPQKIESHVETLGEILIGETLENSLYQAEMLKPKLCTVLCKVPLTEESKKRFKQLIDDEYIAEWMADGLPALLPHPMSDGEAISHWYSLGFPIGWKEYDDEEDEASAVKYFVYNYISIIFKYRKIDTTEKRNLFLNSNETPDAQKYQIVGFEVVPMSFDNPSGAVDSYCSSLPVSKDADVIAPLKQSFVLREYIPVSRSLNLDQTNEITFIYDIKFEETPNIEYSKRWDTYLQSQRIGLGESSLEIHWFSIINSLVVVLVLSGIVAMILIRTLHKDIAKYNELGLSSEEVEESGWKLVHGDVFRKPQHSTILAALTGSGIQILSMVFVTLMIACVGVAIYPSTGLGRGRLLQAALFLWSVMGILGGYVAARFYKLFQSPNWKMTTIRTALIYPAVVFTVFIIINLFITFTRSSAAVPFSVISLLMVIWFGISTPLVFLGAYFGFKQPSISIPVRVNKIPRQIPAQPFLIHPIVTCLAGGALPFGAVFTELMFVFSSIWQHRTYMLFGLLLLVTLILVVTCAEIAIAMTYFQLLSEDYCWWWRSFFISGASGLYVFTYSLVYNYTRLNLSHFTSVVIYLGYSIIISYTFTILTGTIGFIACFLFVRAIYGSIRVD